MPNQLEALRRFTTVVADTGDFETMQAYRPTDATTNPTLILKAVQQEAYKSLLTQVLKDYPNATLAEQSDRLLVAFGCRILALIPGRVSTEVDARLSFDTQASVERARQIISMYESQGIERTRVLIKLASTWEGILAAKQLESEGIHCNLTLLFALSQAIACAQAKVTLISPFVGRIYDWHKKNAAASWDEAAHAGLNDPGVLSVTNIYNYFKAYDINTQIMGASFRNVGQIQALAGCDLLTISPALLAELAASQEALPLILSPACAKQKAPKWQASNEISFRTQFNMDAMAVEKLSEGIRLFTADAIKLDALLSSAQA